MSHNYTLREAGVMVRACTLLSGVLMCLVSTGGAISNMYSVMIARYKYFPEVKTKGMSAAPRLVLFTSEHVGSTLRRFFLWTLVVVT